jgi:hypothetical protein
MCVAKTPSQGKPSIVETDNGRWALLDADGCIVRDDLSHAQAWDLYDWYDPEACAWHDQYLRNRIAFSQGRSS